MFVPLPAYQMEKTTETCEDVAGDSKRIKVRGNNTEYFVTMFFTAFFLCIIVMFCSFIPGLGDGNIRHKSKRDVCDVQRTSLPLQVTLGEEIRR